MTKKAEVSRKGTSADFYLSACPDGVPPEKGKISALLRIPTLALPKSGEVEGIHPPLSPLPRTPLHGTVYASRRRLSTPCQSSATFP